MGKRERLTRTQDDLLSALARHVRLLLDYYSHAFQEDNPDYLGEVAGKLRLLACETRMNRPLLLDLMDELEFEGEFPLRSSGEATTLREYMNMFTVAVRIPSGELVQMTNSELVLAWSQQIGASHEDWELDPALVHAVYSGVYTGGVPASARALSGIARSVLYVAGEFQAELDNNTDPNPH